MNIAAKVLTALAVSAGMTTVVVSGEPDKVAEKPVVLASLIIQPVNEAGLLADLGPARSLSIPSSDAPALIENEIAAADTPYLTEIEVASYYEAESLVAYRQEFDLAGPVPVPTPRPQAARVSVPAPAPARAEQRTVRQQARVAAIRADDAPTRPRFRAGGPIVLGVYR